MVESLEELAVQLGLGLQLGVVCHGQLVPVTAMEHLGDIFAHSFSRDVQESE
jgi:hypothetical protein